MPNTTPLVTLAALLACACTPGAEELADAAVSRDAGHLDAARSITDGDAGGTHDAGDLGCVNDLDCPTDFACEAMTGTCVPDTAEPTCHVARCANDLGVSCDAEYVLDCTVFGAGCEEFVDEGGTLAWCGCGDIPEGNDRCLGDHEGVYCAEDGIAQLFACPIGTYCEINGAGEATCLCDDAADGVCPDPVCTSDSDCGGCSPTCGAAVCGDNGCGGLCGTCGLGTTCREGVCASSCSADCSDRECGGNGCGGLCGSCDSTERCNDAGQCVSDCTPSCRPGQECGSDGCGGRCGAGCASGETCEADECVRDCFFSHLTYTFDASGFDWANTNYVAVRARQRREDGSFSGYDSIVLTSEQPSRSLSFAGACDPDIEVERSHSMRGGVTCDSGPERVARASIVLPAPVLSGGSCSAPAL